MRHVQTRNGCSESSERPPCRQFEADSFASPPIRWQFGGNSRIFYAFYASYAFYGVFCNGLIFP